MVSVKGQVSELPLPSRETGVAPPCSPTCSGCSSPPTTPPKPESKALEMERALEMECTLALQDPGPPRRGPPKAWLPRSRSNKPQLS